MFVRTLVTAAAALAVCLPALPGRAADEPKTAAPRVVAGTYQSQKGMLLARQGADGPWQAVAADAPLYTGDLLIGMAGAVLDSSNKAVRLQLQADYDSPLPLLEPGVILHADPDRDLDFTLDRGRVDVTNQKKEGPARVRVRIWGQTWEAVLAAPGASLAVEMVGRWRPGKRFDPKVGSTELPSVNGLDASPQFLDKLPPWAGRSTDAAVRERLEKLREVRQRLIDGLASKPPEEVIDELLASDDPLHRRLGVILAGATDRLDRLGKVLANSHHQDVWDNAVLVLRHWLGRAPGQDQKLYDGLVHSRGFTPVQALTVLEFLQGFSEDERARPETYQMLIDFLVNDRLAIRGLAYWHLIRLVPDGQKIPYDPLSSHADREKARALWKKRLPPGKLPFAREGAKP
jgi:hypothetical protein